MGFWSRLFRRKKKEAKSECVHQYELLKKVNREIEVRQDWSYTVEDVYIYCPKCRNRKCVSPLEWDLIQKQQKIDTDYMKRNDIYLIKHEAGDGGETE